MSDRGVSKYAENDLRMEVRQRRRTLLDLIRIIFRLKSFNKKEIVFPETPMFGKGVEEHVDDSGVSLFVVWCVEVIQTTGDGLHTDGLYRASGSKLSVDKIARTDIKNMLETLKAEQNVHVLAGALKTFLRCLKHPLLLAEKFGSKLENENENKKIKITEYKQALSSSCRTYEENCTLKFLLEHFLRVAECQLHNKMNIKSLAHIIGPVLVRSHKDTTDIDLQIQVTQFILENYNDIFSSLLEKPGMFGKRRNSSYDIGGVHPSDSSVAPTLYRKIGDSSYETPRNTAGQEPRKSTELRKSSEPRKSSGPRESSGQRDQSPMFGCNLKDSVDKETGASQFVVWCVCAIETTGDNLKTDALYRASGNQARVQEISATAGKYMQEKLASEVNVNVLTGALKLFFRQLKEPLLDHNMFQCVSLQSKDDDQDACRVARKCIESLGDVERATLKYMMKHLKEVLKHSASNNMGVEGMGVVFGPTFMRLGDDSVNVAGDMRQQNRIIEFLFNNYEQIFIY